MPIAKLICPVCGEEIYVYSDNLYTSSQDVRMNRYSYACPECKHFGKINIEDFERLRVDG